MRIVEEGIKVGYQGFRRGKAEYDAQRRKRAEGLHRRTPDSDTDGETTTNPDNNTTGPEMPPPPEMTQEERKGFKQTILGIIQGIVGGVWSLAKFVGYYLWGALHRVIKWLPAKYCTHAAVFCDYLQRRCNGEDVNYTDLLNAAMGREGDPTRDRMADEMMEMGRRFDAERQEERAETERAMAEAERARAEAERARAKMEAERQEERAELEKLRARFQNLQTRLQGDGPLPPASPRLSDSGDSEEASTSPTSSSSSSSSFEDIEEAEVAKEAKEEAAAKEAEEEKAEEPKEEEVSILEP